MNLINNSILIYSRYKLTNNNNLNFIIYHNDKENVQAILVDSPYTNQPNKHNMYSSLSNVKETLLRGLENASNAI